MDKNTLKKFVGNQDVNNKNKNEDDNIDETTISTKDGLLERIDKKLVTKEGKQLLKEQLYERN